MIRLEVPSRYRGEIFCSDEIVCGDLINDGTHTGFAEIRNGKEIFCFVDPCSLKKLAGYDRDGKEVWLSLNKNSRGR